MASFQNFNIPTAMPELDLIANTWQPFDMNKVAAHSCAETYAQVLAVGLSQRRSSNRRYFQVAFDLK